MKRNISLNGNKKPVFPSLAFIMLFSLASTATLELDQKHVFTGEEFTMTFTIYAPTSQDKIVFDLKGQKQEITIPALKQGSYSTKIRFKAPDKSGFYKISSSVLEKEIRIEEPLLVLKELTINPNIINPRESARLIFKIKNEGDFSVYNVRARLDVIGSKDNYELDFSEHELFPVMEPDAETTRNMEIKTRENAKGEDRIGIIVSYEFDNEKHYRSDYVTLSVGKFPWVEIIVIVIIILLVGRFVLTKVGV